LTTLFAIQGGRPYLIHARTNVSLTLTGTVPPANVSWTPNAYNFVGFPLVSPGAPTFHQFFQGSPAHNHNQLYRLVEGTWRQVLNPAQETMRAGEAFWIYCRGRSDYPGPIEVTTRWGSALNLTTEGGGEVIFRNRTVHPVGLTLEHIIDPALPIPLSTPVRVQEEEFGRIDTLYIHYETDAFVHALPAVEAGQAIRLPFVLRMQDAGPGERFSLLKVTTDLGTVSYVPVTALRDDQ
jgi:hypothetical protein